MATKINSKTTLRAIKQFAMRDFGIEITNAQAREIKDAVRRGCAVWTGEHYISTVSTDDIVMMTRKGVAHTAYRTFYTRREWNEAVRNGDTRGGKNWRVRKAS